MVERRPVVHSAPENGGAAGTNGSNKESTTTANQVREKGDIRQTIRRRIAEARQEGWDRRSQTYLAVAAVLKAIPTMSKHDALVLVNMVRDGYFRRPRRMKPRPE